MSTIVGTKGQVVIEKRIREDLGVQPGSIALQRRIDDRVEIRFLPPEHNRSLLGILSTEIRGSTAGRPWPEVVEEAWHRSITERWGDPEAGS
jgi:bifunctional DNA-binding transcriptional regulator/antitoxin component of YhaV-PrlF toxin-antitoxin module